MDISMMIQNVMLAARRVVWIPVRRRPGIIFIASLDVLGAGEDEELVCGMSQLCRSKPYRKYLYYPTCPGRGICRFVDEY